jgi:tetratricopeptide (TPR) repeat protein
VSDQDDRHLDAIDVEDLLARRLPSDRRRRVVGHLLGGCQSCRARVRTRLAQARDEVSAYQGAIDAALAKSAVLIRRELADLAAGAVLWAGLRDQPAGRRMMMVRNCRRYGTPGVLAALLRDYHEALWRDPREGLEVAELGVAIAERLDTGSCRLARLADLHSEALGIAANAKRLASCHGEAARLLLAAERMRCAGSGDLLLEGRLLTYQGSIWQTLRHFDEAAQAFGRAEQVYRKAGEPHLAARSLVARAEAIGYLHPVQGVRLIRRAIPDIDGARDPHLELAAHHSLAWYLNDAGQGWEARAEVGRSAALYQRFSGDAVASLSRAWLQGRIDRSLHDLDQARRSYERAWAGFEELGMEIHLTMLSIDRAELQVAAGELASAAALLARTLQLVESWGVGHETRAVLRLLRETVLSRQCERAAFRQASLAVRRSWAKAGTGGPA